MSKSSESKKYFAMMAAERWNYRHKKCEMFGLSGNRRK
jgi:hypothetical protein